MKAKLAALESKLNQISLSNYYTKSECDNQYTVKPPTIEVLEERHYRKDSDGHDKIASHSGEHFIMHGLAPNGYSFNLNQIINEGEVIRLSSGDYIFFNQSDDGQYLVCNTFLQNIYYCAAYIDKSLSYINA